jgi:hypothetical protein
MGIFNSTFRQHIIDELNFRKTREGRQQVYHPTARVTALVQGSLNGEQLKGFTLGVPDTNLVKSLDQMTNIDGRGTVVGITYNESTPREVRVDSKINLPSPGVTDITIATHSKGGYVFQATINIKFYGKEQYDFIYQTFMRPGNPILIEYGHTRTAELVKQFNDLDFFTTLDDEFVKAISDDIEQISKLQPTRSSAAVGGRVSNFKISLNENDEYEASITVINALEFLPSLSPTDTFLDYENPEVSNSIKNNFGVDDSDEEYNPQYDRVYKKILKDITVDIDPATLSDGVLKYVDNPLKKSILQSGEVTKVDRPSRAERQWGISGTDTEEIVPANEQHDYTYVSLEYVLNEMLPVILKATVRLERNNCLTAIIKTPDQIKLESQYTITAGAREAIEQSREDPRNPRPLPRATVATKNRFGAPSRIENRLRTHEQDRFESNDIDTFANIMVRFERIKYWKHLRSTNIRDVIINNLELYTSNFYQTERKASYKEKFEITDGEDELSKWFKINDLWKETEKEVYGSDYIDGRVINSGIFINYQRVRDAFLNSSSVSAAIVRILNLINRNTNNILNLKMRNLSVNKTQDDIVFESYDIVIYDENSLPNKKEVLELYEFFENDVSEAISYDFDFSLPSAVASTVIAIGGVTPSPTVIGSPELNQLLRSGQNPNIQSMIGSESDTSSPENYELCETPTELILNSSNTNQASESEQTDPQQDFAEQLGEFYTTIVGYQELMPASMKSQVINTGLFNTLPTGAKVSLKLNGIDGFRFGDMFSVRRVLPSPYDENNIFMITGHKHDISSDGWITTIDGQMIASTVQQFSGSVGSLAPSQRGDGWDTPEPEYESLRNQLDETVNLEQIDSRLRDIVEEVRGIVEEYPTATGAGRLRLKVISGFRSTTTNTSVEGAKNSAHLTGDAIDFQLYEWTSSNRNPRVRILRKPLTRNASTNYGQRCIGSYTTVGLLFKEIGRSRGVTIRWGGEFETLYDPNHVHIASSDRLVNGIRVGER